MVSTEEGRIADKPIKPWVLSAEHLRKLDLPVEGHRGLVARFEPPTDGIERLAKAQLVWVGQVCGKRFGCPFEPLPTLLVVLPVEKRGDHQITVEPQRIERLIDQGKFLTQQRFRRAVGRLTDFAARFRSPLDALADYVSEKVSLFLRFPVKPDDLNRR